MIIYLVLGAGIRWLQDTMPPRWYRTPTERVRRFPCYLTPLHRMIRIEVQLIISVSMLRRAPQQPRLLLRCRQIGRPTFTSWTLDR